MIYLIDDTPLEMTGQYIDLDEYRDVIERIGEGSPEDIERMRDAGCVLMHSSFPNTAFVKALKKDLCGFGDDVPLALFSNGNAEDVEFDGDRFIVSIRKDRMYSNLAVFLQACRRGVAPDLKLLAYGEHYARERASVLAGKILSTLMFQPGGEPVLPEGLPMVTMEEFVALSSPGIGTDCKGMLDGLRDVPMPAAEFRSKINRILDSFNQYGKNIYHW